MLDFPSILTYFGGFLALIVVFYINKLLIRPYVGLAFYKKQGLDTHFAPILGEIKRMIEDCEKHGDIYYNQKRKNFENPRPRAWATHIGDVVHVMLKDPELIKNYYINQDRFYEKLPEGVLLLKQISGAGVLLTEGEVWKRHRKLTSSAFNYEFLKEMIPDLVDLAGEYLEKFKNKDMKNLEILSEFQEITGEIVGRVFLGEDLSKYNYQGDSMTKCIAKLLAESTQLGLELPVLLFSPQVLEYGLIPSHRKFSKKVKEFKSIMKKIIIEKLEKSGMDGEKKKKTNLIEIFNKQKEKNPKEAFTPEEIVDECVTFFQAGTDSTGHLISIATYFYLTNPECQSKIFKEINQHFSDPSKITIDSLNQMDYMTAFLKECLRMTPTAAVLFPRVAIEDNDLGDLKIKKGTAVNIAYLSNYYDSQYHQEPNKFMPERWIDDDSLTKKSVMEYPSFYTPFSGGSRNCVGQHLAMNETKIIFSLFLKKFDYSLVDKNYELKMGEGALYEPLVPIVYELKEKV